MRVLVHLFDESWDRVDLFASRLRLCVVEVVDRADLIDGVLAELAVALQLRLAEELIDRLSYESISGFRKDIRP